MSFKNNKDSRGRGASIDAKVVDEDGNPKAGVNYVSPNLSRDSARRDSRTKNSPLDKPDNNIRRVPELHLANDPRVFVDKLRSVANSQDFPSGTGYQNLCVEFGPGGLMHDFACYLLQAFRTSRVHRAVVFNVEDIELYLTILLENRIKYVNGDALDTPANSFVTQIPSLWWAVLSSIGRTRDTNQLINIVPRFNDFGRKFDTCFFGSEDLCGDQNPQQKAVVYSKITTAQKKAFIDGMSGIFFTFAQEGFEMATAFPRNFEGDVDFMMFTHAERKLEVDQQAMVDVDCVKQDGDDPLLMHTYSMVDPATQVLAALVRSSRLESLFKATVSYSPISTYTQAIHYLASSSKQRDVY